MPCPNPILGIFTLSSDRKSLVIHNYHKILPNRYIATVEQNKAVREALMNAFTSDTNAQSSYLHHVRHLLLNANVINEPLSRHDVKILLDAYTETVESTKAFKGMIEMTAAKITDKTGIKGLTNLSGRDATGIPDHVKLMKLLRLSQTEKCTDSRLQELVDHCKKAEDSLRHAYSPKSKESDPEDSRSALTNAATSLLDFEYALRSAVNDRQLRSNQGLQLLMDYCSSRAAEIMTIAIATEGTGYEDGKTLRDLVASKATTMHGNKSLVNSLEVECTKLQDFLKQLEQEATDQNRPVNADELEHIRAGFRNLRIKLSEITTTESSLATAINDRINQALLDIRTMSGFNFKQHALELLNSYLQPQTNIQRVYERIKSAINNVADAEDMKHRICSIIDDYFPRHNRTSLLTILKRRLIDLIETYKHKRSLDVSSGTLLQLLQGDIGLDSLVTAHVHHFPEEMVDSSLDDRFVISDQDLGKGAFNSVQLLTYELPNGTRKTRVFKSEYRAHLALSFGEVLGYAPENTIADSNQATQRCAKMMGFKSIISPMTVGRHNNKTGFFMKEAEGQTAVICGRSAEGPFSPMALAALDFNNLTNRVGSLARETCKLQWLDWLTGQPDRHGNNYLVALNGNSNTAIVTAIDNDLAFPDNRIGLAKFKLNLTRRNRLLLSTGTESDQDYNNTYGDDSLTKSSGDWLLDLKNHSQENLYDVECALGLTSSYARPNRIPSSLYQWLQEVNKNDSYSIVAKSLLPDTRFSDAQRTALIERMKEMYEHAKSLAENPDIHGVMKEDEWLEPKTLRSVFGENDIGQVNVRECLKCNELDRHFSPACMVFIVRYDKEFVGSKPA